MSAEVLNQIPFVEGQDECERQNNTQSRQDFYEEMIGHSVSLMSMGSGAAESAHVLSVINDLYLETRASSRVNRVQMGINLERAVMSQVERRYQQEMINRGGRQLQFVDSRRASESDVDAVLIGHYNVADCQMNITASLMIVKRNNDVQTIQATGNALGVANALGDMLFHMYQSTKIPAHIQTGNGYITIIAKGEAPSVTRAHRSCERLGGRLPSVVEYGFIDDLGTYNGGFTLSNGHQVWALSETQIYNPQVAENYGQSPAQSPRMTNERIFQYLCVQ